MPRRATWCRLLRYCGCCFAIDRFSANLLRPASMAKTAFCPSKTEIPLAWVTNPDVGRFLFFVFLAVLPVLFSTHTLENFEYPKSMWLRAWVLCFLVPLLVKACSHVPSFRRLLALCKTDLMTVGVLLFAASALVSTLTSLNGRISWWGEHTSYAGLATILAYVGVFFVARTLGSSVVI